MSAAVWIPNRTRFHVLSRDGFRCVFCGATPKDGARLLVDLRVSFADGGANEPDNMATTCEACSLGMTPEKTSP